MSFPETQASGSGSRAGTSNNLPRPLTSFVGREREIAEITGALESARLLTLTGAGGSGKTRLAVEAARRISGAFPGGVWFIDLSTLADPYLLPASVASVLGIREEPSRDITAGLVDYLQPLKALLLLDNCEHLAAACASLCDTLLLACPDLVVLATSRMPLGLDYEATWRVPSLSVPDPADLPPLEELAMCEGVRLFVERVRLRRPDFTLTRESAPAVAQLCYRLDGLPLAIELAAPRARVLSVEQIVERLDERFRLLTASNQGALPRQQTLTALMDWGYDLLSDGEKALFRGLSVFAGVFTLEAVVEIWGGEVDEIEIIDLLTRLVDKSMVTVDERGTQARYRMLETIREYAAHKLAEQGEAPDLQRRHRDWYLNFAEVSQMELLSPRQGQWLERMEWEHGNLRAAFAWSLKMEPESDAAMRIAGALVWFWYFRGYLSEGRASLAAALDLPGSLGHTPERAKALNAAGALAYLQSDYENARTLLELALALARELDDRRTIAFALSFLGQVLTRQGDVAGEMLCNEAVDIFRGIGDTWGQALSLDFLGDMAWARGDDIRALQLHDESLALYRRLGDTWGIALQISNFGRAALRRGDYSEAMQRLEEALSLQQQVGDNWSAGWTLHNLGDAARGSGDNERAARFYSESMRLFERLGERWGLASSLHMMGHMAQHRGDYKSAASLFDDSLALFRELGDKRIIAHSLYSMGEVARRQGSTERASALFAESLVLIRQLGDEWGRGFQFNWMGIIAQQATHDRMMGSNGLALCGGLGDRTVIAEGLEWFGSLAMEAGDTARGTRLFGAAQGIREKIGVPLDGEVKAAHEQQLEAAKAPVGEARFSRWLAEGRAMSTDDAIGLALDRGHERPGADKSRSAGTQPPGGQLPEDLTPREAEVLRLIAAGFSDARIAEELTLSSRTVQAHVRSIYTKLGVGNRSAATRYALDHGLE